MTMMTTEHVLTTTVNPDYEERTSTRTRTWLLLAKTSRRTV